MSAIISQPGPLPGAQPGARSGTPPRLAVDDVTRWYRARRGLLTRWRRGGGGDVRAVDGVSFELNRGEVLGVIGESGSGKSTLGELVTYLQTATGGSVRYDGTGLSALGAKALKTFRKDVQMVFQDPYATLNPRYRVGRTLTEPLVVHGVKDRAERHRRAVRALDQAGLAPAEEFMEHWPDELSGGQRQRVAIARALVLEPKVLIADEPVSMLDVSVQGAILNLLRELCDTLGLSILFISHDLSTVRYLCDRVAIMYLGVIVEMGETEEIMERARHPYTRALLHAVPTIGAPDDVVRELPVGELGSVLDVTATECRFADRCPHAADACRDGEPDLLEVAPGHRLRCLFPRSTPVWDR